MSAWVTSPRKPSQIYDRSSCHTLAQSHGSAAPGAAASSNSVGSGCVHPAARPQAETTLPDFRPYPSMDSVPCISRTLTKYYWTGNQVHSWHVVSRQYKHGCSFRASPDGPSVLPPPGLLVRRADSAGQGTSWPPGLWAAPQFSLLLPGPSPARQGLCSWES